MIRSISISAFLIASTAPIAAEASTAIPLPAPLDFIAVDTPTFKTEFAYTAVDTLAYWAEPGYHTGLQSTSLTWFNIKDIPEDFEVPESPYFYVDFIDAYGNSAAFSKIDLTSDFEKLLFVDSFISNPTIKCSIMRGGEYTVGMGMSPNLYRHEERITVNDEACARVSSTRFKDNEDKTTTLFITSGYPYNPESVKGIHELSWVLTPKNDPTYIIADGASPFSLETEQVLMAAVDSVEFDFWAMEPGAYHCIVTSDFTPANRTFDLEILDVLKAEITKDKEHYVLGTDSEANLQIAMTYGYPYISENEETGKPTINVIAQLLDEEYTFDFSDEKWGDSAVDYIADIKVPLKDVTYDIANENDWRVPLSIKVKFNGAIQAEIPVEISIVNTSGIESIASDSTAAPRYYNVFGQSVDDSYKGVVVTSDGRKLLLRDN